MHVLLEQMSRDDYSIRGFERFLLQVLMNIHHELQQRSVTAETAGSSNDTSKMMTAMFHLYSKSVGTPANFELLLKLLLAQTGEIVCTLATFVQSLAECAFLQPLDRPLSDGKLLSSHLIGTCAEFLHRRGKSHQSNLGAFIAARTRCTLSLITR